MPFSFFALEQPEQPGVERYKAARNPRIKRQKDNKPRQRRRADILFVCVVWPAFGRLYQGLFCFLSITRGCPPL
jgi:hypothetical protein